MRGAAVFALAVAALTGATIGVFGKMLGAYMSPIDVVFGRAAIFFAALCLIFLARGKRPNFADKKLQVFGFGFFGLFVGGTLFLVSVFYTSVSNAIFLFCLYPVTLLFLNKDKYTGNLWRYLAYSAVGISGVLLVVEVNALMGTAELLGCALALLAGVSFAVAMTFSKSVMESCEPEDALFGSALAALPFIIVLFLVFGTPHTYLALPPAGWGELLAIALFSTLFGAYLMLFGIKRTEAITAGMILLLQPFFAIPLAFFTLGEVPRLVALFGGVLIVVAAALSVREETRKRVVVH